MIIIAATQHLGRLLRERLGYPPRACKIVTPDSPDRLRGVRQESIHVLYDIPPHVDRSTRDRWYELQKEVDRLALQEDIRLIAYDHTAI